MRAASFAAGFALLAIATAASAQIMDGGPLIKNPGPPLIPGDILQVTPTGTLERVRLKDVCPWQDTHVTQLTGDATVPLGDRQRICRPGFSQTLRLDRNAYYQLRDAAFARAGTSTSMQCHRNDPRPNCMIMDHIIPLELDPPNPNSLDNIQIQARADSDAKDKLENQARDDYCAGRLTLEQARSAFQRTSP